MRNLDIVFTKSIKKLPIGSWSIMWWTNKEYSHVARMTTLYGSVNLYYQASDGKVNYECSDIFLSKHQIIYKYTLNISDELYKKISEKCVSNAGKKYGLLQNIGIVYSDIMSKIGISVDTPFKNGQNCSELIYECVIKELIPHLKYNKNLIKPHQIEDIILKYFQCGVDGFYTLK